MSDDCKGTYKKQFLGSPFQHWEGDSAIVPKFINVTKVPDYRLENPDPNGIAPYPSPNTLVAPTPPNCAILPDCEAGQPVCNGLDKATATGCLEEDKQDGNCYLESGTLDFNTCRKIGFKNVQAKKYWHGRHGYLSHDPNGLVNSYCCDYSTASESPQPAPDTTKYLSFSGNVEYSYSDTAFGKYYAGNASSSCSVNPYSGIKTYGASIWFNNERGKAEILGMVGLPMMQPDAGGTFFGQREPYLTVTCEGTSFRKEFSQHYADESSEMNDSILVTYDISSRNYTYTRHSDEYRNDIPGSEGILTLFASSDTTESLTFTNTSMSYEYTHNYYGEIWDDETFQEAVGTTSTEVTATGTLGNPYTAANVYSDIKSLLSKWNLTDDKIYPWRTDEYCSVAPLVTYNEIGPSHPFEWGLIEDPNNPGSYIAMTDPLAAEYDGSIRGEPLPAGYQNHYDWKHKNWNVCEGLETGAWIEYVESIGAVSGKNETQQDPTDLVVPANATQWTESWPAGYVEPYAFVKYSNGTMYAQKWAEIKINRPVFNYARPCGEDRFAFDEPTVRCITEHTEGNVTVDIYALGASAINTGDTVLVCGTASANDGIWTVTKNSDTNYSLGPKITDLPSGYGCSDTGVIGKLRFPMCPGLCGKVKIVNATNTTPIIITLADRCSLRTDETVKIENCKGNTAANGVWKVTVDNPLQLTLQNSSGNGIYTGEGLVYDPFAPNIDVNSTDPRGEFSYLEWNFNQREVAEATRLQGQYDWLTSLGCPAGTRPANVRENQALWGMPSSVYDFRFGDFCIPFTPCSPQVLAITPNEEQFPNGAVFGFPEGFVADERYGSRWQAVIRQHIPDPLWQPPHKPCEMEWDAEHPQECDWHEDNGTCVEDTVRVTESLNIVAVKFYPHRPYVESISRLPAEVIPTAASIGCATLEELDTVTQPTKPVCYPPGEPLHQLHSALPHMCGTPWGIYLRQYDCVCNDGRFKEEYMLNGVICPFQEEEGI